MEKEIPYGKCHCGCGKTTKLHPQTTTKIGAKKGDPYKFIRGHNMRGLPGFRTGMTREKSSNWNGGRILDTKGYVFINKPSYHRASKRGYVLEHILIAEKALGKRLPRKAIVHHVDENPSNNLNNNLVICQDQKYHMLLHMRSNALKACGNPNWLKCQVCGEYDDPINLVVRKKERYHKECFNKRRRDKNKQKT